MMSLRWISGFWCLAACLLIAAGGTAWAKEPKQKYRFTNEKILHFGQDYADVNDVIEDEDNWSIGARIETPSTAELWISHNGYIMYVMRFFRGKCWFIEKRAIMSAERAEEAMQYYGDKLGPTPETAQSSEGDLMYAQWLFPDRTIELTTIIHDPDTYKVFCEEYDPMIEGEFWYALEAEFEAQPMDIDPITGKPRMNPEHTHEEDN